MEDKGSSSEPTSMLDLKLPLFSEFVQGQLEDQVVKKGEICDS